MRNLFTPAILVSVLSTLLLSGLLLSGCGTAPAPKGAGAGMGIVLPSLPQTVEAAVSSNYRTPQNTERDQYRHPVETLNFFGIKPTMTVVEISPGAGWYMEILAPFLATSGQYIAAAVPSSPENTYMAEMNAKTAAWLKGHPELESKVKFTAFNPPEQVDIAPEASADMVVTFRNVHNWMSKGSERAAFQSFFKALKPGGILGVVEHRADPKAKRDPKAKNGYVNEADLIKLIESVGFKLEEKSEVNANPKDTKDYAEGVWTLPPTLRLRDQEREKYMAIGESDRMTLRFVKVAKAAKVPKKLPKK